MVQLKVRESFATSLNQRGSQAFALLIYFISDSLQIAYTEEAIHSVDSRNVKAALCIYSQNTFKLISMTTELRCFLQQLCKSNPIYFTL